MTEKTLPDSYIELIKKTLINEIYIENEIKIFYLMSGLLFGTPVDLRFLIKPELIPDGMPESLRIDGLKAEKENKETERTHQLEIEKLRLAASVAKENPASREDFLEAILLGGHTDTKDLIARILAKKAVRGKAGVAI